VLIDERVYMATLVDLPCMVEAQKTLDYRTFFKSADVSQMLYIHSKYMEGFMSMKAEEVIGFAAGFNPFVEEPEFLAGLYRKQEVMKRVEEAK
jgi:TATA-binding protein-associated factor Taf7